MSVEAHVIVSDNSTVVHYIIISKRGISFLEWMHVDACEERDKDKYPDLYLSRSTYVMFDGDVEEHVQIDQYGHIVNDTRGSNEGV